MKTRAAVCFREQEPWEVVEVDIEPPRADEVLVRMAYAGLCHTDEHARFKDMERDGVAAAVLYTSVGFSLFGIKDPALQQACFAVYNDWLAEFCRAAPHQFAGLALISLYDMMQGTCELERCRKLGLKGAMIWSQAPEYQPYRRAIYDRFWAAAQELQMPLACMKPRTNASKAVRGSEPTLSIAFSTSCRWCMKSSRP